jgi:organic hydroperoxide reductase OsmC/OhrA
MPKPHVFRTGNRGTGTSGYRDYSRDHEIVAEGKSVPVAGSSAPAFRGDPARYNPEEMLIAALSACHMLWLLHLCADAGIVVTSYEDAAEGELATHPDGSGELVRVILRPSIRLANAERAADVAALHHRAHELCFIARSVNFPVQVQPEILD